MVSDACLVVSVGVDVCRLVLPELNDVYGQIFLPVHVTDTAKQCCCCCTVAADAMLLLMQCCC